jgi:cell division protein FtsQ
VERVRRLSPQHARLAAALAVLLALLLGAWLWLRDSSLVAVRQVTVTGVSSSQGAEVRSALTDAATTMTTLHVRQSVLDDAVRGFSSVASLSVHTDFPHRMTIEVTERRPIALVAIAGEDVPVGAGGRLMRGVRPVGPLPRLTANRLAPGGELTDPKARAAVAALAAAPQILRTRVARVFTGPKGLTLDFRSGPELFFGAAHRLDAKWMATARVLADPSAAGAVYLDVRIPERPAAGGLGTVPPDAIDPLMLDPQDAQANPQVQPEQSTTLNP